MAVFPDPSRPHNRMRRSGWTPNQRTRPAGASAPETTVFVFVHHRKELIEKHRFRMVRINVPFQVRAHPMDLPPIRRADEGGLRDGLLDLFVLVTPARANGMDQHALSIDAPGQVDLVAQVFGRAALGQEIRHRGLDCGDLFFREGHAVTMVSPM